MISSTFLEQWLDYTKPFRNENERLDCMASVDFTNSVVETIRNDSSDWSKWSGPSKGMISSAS